MPAMRPRRSLAAALLLLAAGCAHAPPAPEFSQRIRSGRCEDAASFLRAHKRGPPIESQLKRAVALPLSYLLTGAAYTAEVAVVVGGGIVVSGAICAPILALEASANGSGNGGAQCLATMLGAVFEDAELPGAGRGVHAATRGWRCVDMTPISEDLRAIAECYAWRGGEGDLERARRQLEVLRRSEELIRCVSDAERAEIDRIERWVAERAPAPPPAPADPPSPSP